MGKISRRRFLGSAAASVAVGGFLTGKPEEIQAAASRDNPPDLPWQREVSLREAARSVFIEKTLDPHDPTPDVPTPGARGTGWPRGPAMAITNPAMKSSIWGPPHRITLSILKTDVHDRRVKWPRVVTLQEIREGAFSPVNRDAIPVMHDTTRAISGYLMKGGGRKIPYVECWHAYPFPCQKPVGQIIVMLDDLEGAPAPKLRQGCANGLTRLQVRKKKARLDLEIILSATRNVYAIRARFTSLTVPGRLRLYRHQDQGHLMYMTRDGKFRALEPGWYNSGTPTKPLEVDGRAIAFDYQADSSWNGPIEPPTSGREGRYFWVRQQMPAEKTFPQGFGYVMMGLVPQPADSELEVVNGQTGLGTPPPDESIRNASGAAATVTLPAKAIEMTAYVAIVSQIDATDFMGEAKQRLEAAEKDGFDQIVDENTQWYNELYDRRESGRVFYGGSGKDATEKIKGVYSSWYNSHGGGCKTDMRRYQASAIYTSVESDWQLWHGLPCYNEWFYTSVYARNRADSDDMWKQLTEHWWQASRGNAREMFGMPGMAQLHGYLPPIKADKYVHTNLALELCVDTLAQVLRALWDEWDYGGDLNFLKRVYPMLRDMALFYAAYTKKGDDGYFHVIPAMAAECWGIWPEFSHSIDSTGALCMFRWALSSVAEAAELLGRDADLRSQWREIADHMAPYPTWKKPEGFIFARVRDVEPFSFPGDHPWYEGVYPTTLAGDLNLDSSAKSKEMMVRTARVIQTSPNAEALVLLGACPDTVASVLPGGSQPIRDWETLRAEVESHPERLVNSRSGRIHLFPCVPANAVVAFRRFQARGGFLVSAARNEQGVYHVEIEARRDKNCLVMNPWPGRRIAVRDLRTRTMVQFRLDRRNGECVVFEASAGHAYQIEPAQSG